MAGLDHIGDGVRADGLVRYRIDRDGARIGVLPATCKRGLHTLVENYTASAESGTLRVTCETCANAPHPDHSWRLELSGEPPERAELDDTAYVDIEPVFQVRPVTQPGQRPRTTPIATA